MAAHELDDYADEICHWLISGKPLAEYCALNGKPSINKIASWRAGNDIFAKRYAQARDIGFDSIAERLRTTVRGGEGSTNDWKRDRLVAETELKLLAAWAPKRYGARIEAEHNLGNMDIADLAAKVDDILKKAIQALAGRPPTTDSEVNPVPPTRPSAQVPDSPAFLSEAQEKRLRDIEINNW